MKKSVAALGLSALLSLGYFGASAAQADYPDLPLTLSASGTVTSGASFTATASAPGGADFTFTYEGDTKTDSGDTGSATFTAPKVTVKTETTLSVSAETDEAPVAASLTDFAVPLASVGPITKTITVVPAGTGDGSLPDTGADSNTVPLLLVGGLLVAVGGTAVVSARRRQGRVA